MRAEAEAEPDGLGSPRIVRIDDGNRTVNELIETAVW